MNDDEIRRQLKRRANRAAAPDLLPAVAPRLDVRQSQPARVARWAPLAGLAAAAIIVFALVIAWPRNASVGPASSGSPIPGVSVDCAGMGANGFAATITDETGIIQSCNMITANGLSARVTNPQGNTKVIDLLLIGPPCVVLGPLTFSGDANGYTVKSDGLLGGDCPTENVHVAIRVALAEAAEASSVAVALGAAATSTLPTTDVPCAGTITVRDHTGLVQSCADAGEVNRFSQDPRASNPDGDLHRVRVWWDFSQSITTTAVDVYRLSDGAYYILVANVAAPDSVFRPDARAVDIVLNEAVPSASVRLQSYSASSKSAPPPPPSAPSSEETQIQCQPAPTAPDTASIPERLPVVIDTTGLVVSCARTDYYVPPPDTPEPPDIWVANPFGPSGLQVGLLGRPCIDWTKLEFGRTATGYALTGHLNCDSDVTVSGGAYYLVLREPVSADNVTVTTVGDDVVPDFTPSPAPSSGTNAVACPIGALDVPATFTDHSGLVRTCSATIDAQPGPTIPDPIVDGTTVTLVASVDTCALTAIDLDLWHPMAEDVTPYQLQVQSDIREQLTYPVGCGYPANLVITLLLTEPISASDVESFSTSRVGDRAPDVQNSVQTSVGTFTLNLDAESETYATGVAINPSASLYLDGTADQVNLSVERGFGLVGPWLVEQLDGDLYIGNRGSLLMQDCVTMNNHEEKIVPYDKPRWPVSGPPDDSRLKALYDDPLLHLPAGTWRITVWSSFVTDCTSAFGDGEQVAMTPSIVIQVH